MANADISLLFGVLGEGSLGGESGSLIKSQLTQIMTELNKNPLKVKIALDTEAGGQKSWSSQLQSKLNTVSSSGKFSVQVSKLTLGAGAISDFRNQLNAVVNALHLDKGTTITLTAEGIGEIKSKMKQAGDAAEDAARKTAEFKVQMEALGRQKSSVQRALSSLNASATTDDERAKVAELTTQYEQWAVKIEQIRATKTAATSGYRAEIEAEGAAIANNIEMLRQEQAAAAAAAAAGIAAASEQAAAEDAAASAAERGASANKDAAAEQKDLNNARKQGLSLLTQMQKAERDWTAAKTGSKSTEYGQIQDSIRSLQIYLEQLRSGEIDVTTFKQHLAELGSTFASSSNAIKTAGENARTFGEKVGTLAKKFGAWLSVTRVIMTVIQTIKNMVANTRDIDTSLTQLRIVTGATDSEMEAFLTKSTKLAKELGQSITNVLGSIETFSRLGYNLVDASQLAEYANVMANVAAVGTEEATTGLTSIIKGFNMNVSEAEHVADVLVEVGQKYAVSASEMIEAYEKSGAALNATNTSFEKSAGLIAAANASVQNASTVGTALKTISARIRGATADLEALGEDTKELAQGFSKYAKEIKALTGFDIMVDGSTDTYKDIYDIFEGISKVWKDLSDTQQARVAEILGGTRQLQVISSILGNWQDAAGAYTDAMNAAGTATEANAAYMDSINGKMGILSATFQEFSNNIINSGLIKFFVELATAIISALNALEKLHLLLPMVASVVVTIKALRVGLATMNGAVASAETASTINTIVAKLIAEKSATDALTVAVANLTIAEKAELATKIQAAVASGSLSAAEGEQILATLGLITAEGTLTVTNHTLGASFKALMASIPVWGWIALGVSVLITAITALSGAIKSNEEKLEELNEEYNSLYSTIKNVSNEFKSLKSSADEVIPRFAELANGVNKFGDNVSLTDEEYAEFLELNNRVAEMFPELNLGLDENGNYMLALSYDADTLTGSLYDLVEAQRLVAAEKLADTLPDLVDNVKKQEKVYGKEKQILQDRLDNYQEAYDAYAEMYADIDRYKESFGGDWEAYFQSSISGMSSTYVASIRNAFDAFRNDDSWDRLLNKFTDANSGLVDWWAVLNSDEFKNVLAGIEREMDNVGDKIQAKWNSINPALNAWLQTDFIYNDMNEQMQTVARAMVSGLDFSELGLTTAESIENYITDYIINPIYNSGPDVRAAFADITDWQGELRAGEITFEEFSERVKNAFGNLLSSMSEDDAAAFAENFVAGFNAIGIAGSNFDAVVTNIIDNWGAVANVVSGNDIGASIGDLAEDIAALKDAYDLLSTAQEEMASGKGLSADTIGKLAEAEENYLDYLYEENGVVKLNTDMWRENANAKVQSDIAGIQSEIDALEKENESLEKLIATYEEKRLAALQSQDLTTYYDYYHLIDDATAKIEENNKVIAEHQSKIALYEGLFQSIAGAAGQLESTLNVFDGYTNSMESLATLQEAVAKGFTVSADKVRELAEVFPELLESATATANGQIKLNEEVVNAVLEGKRAELNGTIEAEIGKLEAKRALLQAELEIINEQVAAAESADEATVASANEAAAAKMAIEQAVLSACEQAGIDEQTANQLALAAMTGDWDTFSSLAQQAIYDLDDESAIAFTNVMNNFATMSQNIVNNTNEIIGAYSKMGEALSRAMQGLTTSKYKASINGGSVSGKGKDAVEGLLSDMFESAKSDYGNGGTTLDDQMDVWKKRLQDIANDYTSAGSNLDELLSKQASLNNQIASVNGQIQLLESLKNKPINAFKSSTSGGGSSASKKEIEEYTVSIDEYREAIERLNRIQIKRENLETRLSNEKDLRTQIELQKELVDTYKEEQDALHVLNDLRDKTISNGAESLRSLGFEVEYDPDNNRLFIKNLEHINELVADNRGEYDTLQEATNALRKDTESLIDTMVDLNEANQENSESWIELAYAIQEANIAIYENTVKERENLITLTENLLDAAVGEKATERVKQYSDAIVSYYHDMQEAIRQEADYYRSLGYSDTSDEVSKLIDLWWDYEKNIKDVKQNVVDYLGDIVSAASDMVDEIQNVLSVLKDAADEYAENGGFISVDAFQKIVELGPQYMQYLEDENGLLVINEENINRVIAAKTEQLALENALSYVERLRLALEEGSIESLNNLLFATTEATNATWGLVYANLALLDLDDNQYQAALHNINSLRSIAETTIANIGQVTGAAAKAEEEAAKAAEEAAKAAKKELEALRDELNDMKDAGDDIIKYVMDMLKHRIQQQIDALKDMKAAYSDIIKLKKESLKATKAENDYQKSVAAKVKEMAELQAKMDALSLDNSRDAQAERASLAEQLAALQEDLADEQADYALDATMDSLDKMEDAYHKEKDKEIEILEESISSYQKLYDMAIEYISNHWDTLYSELIEWNTEYGSVLNSEITEAWNNCLAAAERYGSFVDAMLGGIEADIARINAEIESLNVSSSSAGSGGYGSTSSGASASNNTVVGTSNNYESDYTSGYQSKISDLVAQMRENSSKWLATTDTQERNRLHDDSVAKANMISRLGVTASYDAGKGTWTIVSDKFNPSNIGKNLLYSYHTGGFAGVQPNLKQNEIMAVLEKGEAILDAEKEKALYRLVDFATILSDRMSEVLGSSGVSSLLGDIQGWLGVSDRDKLSNVTNNKQIQIEFGDMYIYGANEQTVEQHRDVNRKFANDIIKQLNIKR